MGQNEHTTWGGARGRVVLAAGLMALLGLLACMSALETETPRAVVAQPRPAAARPVLRLPAAAPRAEEAGASVRERVEDYTQFPETVAQPTGPLNLLPSSHPLLVAARIRGIQWPMVANDGSSQVYPRQNGVVSFYHEDELVATGEPYNPYSLTAAHRSLPFGTIVRCTRRESGRSVIVMVNDRGPYIRGRILDLSKAAARELGLIGDGVAHCSVDVLAYPLVETMGPKGNG